MARYEIKDTDEWASILGKMQERLAYFGERIYKAAEYDELGDVRKAVGEYHGFRQAIEFLRGIERS